MNDRRWCLSAFVVAGAVAALASCSPDESSQTVSFELALSAKRLNRIEFVVHHSSGSFPGDDGGCMPGATVTPRPTTTTTMRPTTTTVAPPTTTLPPPTTTTLPPVTTTTLEVVTSTTPPTTTPPSTTLTTLPMEEPLDAETIALGLAGTCGNGTRDAGEECDDGNMVSNDGCTSDCDAEYDFDAVVDDNGDLTITVVYGLGIPPGSTLAFCGFEGDIKAANLVVVTTHCDLSTGAGCNPATNATVVTSTTTTTTTTTTSSTTTTTVKVTTTTTLP